MDALRAGYTYPKGRLLPLALGCVKVSSFLTAKTSANKRFFTMFAHPIGVCGCKGTKKIAYAQGLCDFCLLDARKRAAI